MINDLKLMLGFGAEDTSIDDKLSLIVESTKARLKVLLGGVEPPESLSYIILDVSVMRFNRIGSEGMTSHTVEGESQQFSDNDFAGYSEDVQAFLASQKDSARGRVKFL